MQEAFFSTFSMLAAFVVIVSWIAQKLHFFRIKELPRPVLRIKYPLLGFIGYLLLFFFAAPIGLWLISAPLREYLRDSPALLMTIFQVLSLTISIVYLFLFSSIQDRETIGRIVIHPKRLRLTCLLEDFGLGVATWIVAFPLVALVSFSVEFITYLLTGVIGIEQVAIRFLKMASEAPFLFSIALFSAVIVAPIIEEIVFRGLLLTYLKQKLGFRGALLLSALIFSLFHFSPSQGVSNFPILSSLFVLSLYLGFLYERQSSLIAPIALHMTFNSISVIRIFLFSS
ncbi:MAG: hypothetical protein K1060chlam2_00101 [Chlamydiae bacterium]|nr:hypothetical protein [Chlamydiota bacterium]